MASAPDSGHAAPSSPLAYHHRCRITAAGCSHTNHTKTLEYSQGRQREFVLLLFYLTLRNCVVAIMRGASFIGRPVDSDTLPVKTKQILNKQGLMAL
jgi:hypothetical protein